MLSHTALRRTPRKYTRFIYADHAKLVAETGGVIGVWPAGRGGLDRWARRFKKLADVVGPEHLAMGTDMDGLRNTIFDDYGELPDLAAALLAAGFSKGRSRRDSGRELHAGVSGGCRARVMVELVPKNGQVAKVYSTSRAGGIRNEYTTAIHGEVQGER